MNPESALLGPSQSAKPAESGFISSKFFPSARKGPETGRKFLRQMRNTSPIQAR